MTVPGFAVGRCVTPAELAQLSLGLHDVPGDLAAELAPVGQLRQDSRAGDKITLKMPSNIPFANDDHAFIKTPTVHQEQVVYLGVCLWTGTRH